ncbi:MAG TPA: 30S ribosomal protein S18 [Candidatus Paceibacterota bacterium]
MKQCFFCNNGIKTIDYKDIETLVKFIDLHARIAKKRDTTVCSNHQRKLSEAIKRARFLALLPYIAQ